jgi:hypothetical protein
MRNHHPRLYSLPIDRTVTTLSALPGVRTAWRLPNGHFSQDERDLPRLDTAAPLRFRLLIDRRPLSPPQHYAGRRRRSGE